MARGAGEPSLKPTSAGAAKSISEILLELKAKVKALDRGQRLGLQSGGSREKGINTGVGLPGGRFCCWLLQALFSL